MNDVSARETRWRRYAGDEWAAFDALPEPVRRRLHEHAYDAWSVNALMLWRSFRRKRASSGRALAALLRFLAACEAEEQAAFADDYRRQHGAALPHLAAQATVQRYGGQGMPPGSCGRHCSRAPCSRGDQVAAQPRGAGSHRRALLHQGHHPRQTPGSAPGRSRRALGAAAG